MNYSIPDNITSQAELFKYLKANKALIISQKKSAIKHADSIGIYLKGFDSEEVDKGFEVSSDVHQDTIRAKVVINSTKIMDSHDDVHFDGLWKKSLGETKNIYHLQEHSMKFDKVISDEVKAYTKSLSWKSLGFDYEGNTQALVFESTISKDRNPFMYDQYLKGYVKNHSVGMQYVKIDMAVNSEEKYYVEEKAVWDKYYNDIVNKDVADEKGYFFAVTEAKAIEGSAVLRGSNIATPTISITEAGKSTSTIIEPSNDTQKGGTPKSYLDIAKTILTTLNN
jgi:hypothetical protein